MKVYLVVAENIKTRQVVKVLKAFPLRRSAETFRDASPFSADPLIALRVMEVQ